MQNQKPPHSAAIIEVKAGFVPSETFVHKLCSENRSMIGFVVQDTKLEVERFVSKKDLAKEVSTTMEVLNNTKKFNRMFCFQQFPEEYDEDEQQPWIVIKDSKGAPLMVVAIEGDFPGHDVDGSSEFLGLITNLVGPKIEALYTLVGNDPDKLYTAMRNQDIFGKDLLNTIANRGHFFFMPAKGDVFAHGKEGSIPQNGVFPWGSASFTYGYTESVQQAATPVSKETEQPRVSKYATAEAAPEPDKSGVDKNGIHHIPEKPPEEQKPVEVPKADPAPATPTDKVAAETTGGTYWEPPKNVHGKKLKQLYRTMNAKNEGVEPEKGSLNADWAKRPRIFIKHQTEVKALADLAHTAVGSFPKGSVPAEKLEEAKAKQEVLPVISGTEQAKVKEFIKKFLDGASNEVSNPLEMQKEETKLAVFSELCLIGGLDEIERWKTSGVAAFCKSHPEAAWLLILELRRDRINRKQAAAIGDKKLSELTGTEKSDEPDKPTTLPTEQPVHRVSKYA